MHRDAGGTNDAFMDPKLQLPIGSPDRSEYRDMSRNIYWPLGLALPVTIVLRSPCGSSILLNAA